MKHNNVLIIFARNLIHGKVKTRLAATIGDERAMRIYKDLIAHTYSITNRLQCDKIVYYSEYEEEDDIWNGYIKAIQRGNDLGEKMANAFKDVFADKYSKAVIIGTDCFELDREIIEQAFDELSKHDIVIGPAFDGGYYLLGMKSFQQSLFANITWSTDAVFNSTISACDSMHLGRFVLPVLNDVDEEKDLESYFKHID